MSSDSEPNEDSAGKKTGSARQAVPLRRPRLLEIPGVVALGCYMILVSGVICFDVVTGHAPLFYLVFSALFIAGALGMMMLLRWGWAMTLAAVGIMAAFFFWNFSRQSSQSALVQGLLNLVFFLYLIRTDVREKMR
jgi:uncharacterized membrane protein (DUF2068 family)